MPEQVDIQLSGLRKAAIVLLSLGQDVASQVMTRLERDQIENVSRELAELEGIKPLEQDKILDEFYNLAIAHRYMEQGGLSYAQALLENSLSADEAADIIKQVT